MAKFIHNVSGETLIIRGIELANAASFLIPDASLPSWANDVVVNEKIILSQLQMSKDGTTLITDAVSSLSFLKGQIQEVDVKTTTPYAQPEYRTKRDSCESWVECPANTVTHIDYVLDEEKYVTGGEMIYKNAKEGDYITAEVYDINSVIPAPYRAALCENWPTIAKYVVKKFLFPTEPDKYRSYEINTYPLNAKISAGLCLRISYHACDTAGDRKTVVNYYLTKKL